ncbi:hypothetical protein KY342_05730 [Candidatus Woesearchaeota archaeon]|nr:hypothetical protein [Candidatus Woesearchaeota archaeon]
MYKINHNGKRSLDLSKIKTLSIITLIFFMLFVSIYFLGPGLVGWFIAEPGLISYEQNISMTAIGDKIEEWDLEEYPEVFDLRTVKLNGEYIGNGTIKIYLEDDQGNRYLILDNSAIETEDLASVTGYTIAVDVSDEEVEELEEEFEEEVEEEPIDEEPIEEEIEQEEVGEEEINITEEVEDIIEEALEEILENITEEILENITEEVEEEINVTEINISEEVNVTEEILENITEEVEEGIEVEEEEPEEILENVTEEEITEEINITEMINATEVVIKLVDKEIVIKNPVVKKIAGKFKITGDVYERELKEEKITEDTAETNITEEINVTEEVEEINLTSLKKYKNVEFDVIGFEHEFKETWGTITEVELDIDNKENQSIVIGYVILDVEGYEEPAVFELDSPVVIDAGEERVSIPLHFNYEGDSVRRIRVRIKDRDTKIIASAYGSFNPAEAARVEKIKFEDICVETCILPPGLDATNYDLIFEVESGTLDVEQIGYVVKNLTQRYNVKFNVLDYEDNDVSSRIIVDGNETDYNETISLLIGEYDIIVYPYEHTINSLVFEDVIVEDEFDVFIELDQGLEIDNVVQSYAIKPLVEYETVTLNLTVKGDRLYKCSDWSYRWRSCRSEFVLIKDLEENGTYTINVDYGEVAFIETIGINVSNITYRKIKEDIRYDAIIDSTDYNNETDELRVVFHHDYIEPLPIFIKGNVNYALDKNISGENEQVILNISNWNNKRFRILVGGRTEAFEFGVAEVLELTSEVEDSKGRRVDARIELIDSLTEELKAEKTKDEIKETIEEGEYNIKVNLENHSVKEIDFEDIEIYEDFTENIYVDDVNETGNLSEFVEVYAIDPTNLNFTNATVTVTAKGTSLYKCKDWNFTLQECYGNWTLFKTGLVPGQNYTFTLTPEDPGYGESDWWNTSWKYRKQLNITNNNQTQVLEEGYSISFTINTTGNNFLDSGDDVRVVYWNGTDYIELDRWGDEDLGGGWNSSNTIIWFKTQANISAGSSDASYWVYYGNAQAGSAPAYWSDSMGADSPSKVFFAAEDFEEHTNNTDPDGWTDQGTEDFKVRLHGSEKWFQVYTWNMWEDGSTASSMANIGDAVWRAKIYYWQNGSNAWGGIGVRTNNSGDGYLVVVRDGGWYRGNETWGDVTGWMSNSDIHFPLDTKGEIELITHGTNLDAYWHNPPGYSPEKVTLFTGFTLPSGTGKLNVHVERPGLGNTRWIDADNIIVRKYMAPEPTVTVGAEEKEFIPPATVTNLNNQSAGQTWIYWNWTNPSDADFNEAIVYIDGDNVANTSDNFYNATGLNPSTDHTITINTKDTFGNVNDTDVNSTASTSSVLNITSIQIIPDDDNITAGTQINPIESTNVTVTLIANITNTSEIDDCKVRIWNSSGNYSSPTLDIVDGTVQDVGGQTQCNASWFMEYWRNSGDWNLTVDVNLTDSTADNDSSSYYYNVLAAFAVNETYINFSGLPGQTINSSNAYPLEIENFGNKVLNISIKGTDFVGVSDSSFNFSIGNATYNESSSGVFSSITVDYVQISGIDNLGITDIAYLYFRGTIPSGMKSQTYENSISVKGE